MYFLCVASQEVYVFDILFTSCMYVASQEVYVFDNEPKSPDQPSRSDSLPGSSNGSSDMRSALLTVPSAPVVAVCHNPLRPHQVYMVGVCVCVCVCV